MGIIALFVSAIYGIASIVLGTSLDNLQSSVERLPLIWFIITFPILILSAFIYLVIYHHGKLYGPGDYKDEKNFINAFYSNKEIPGDIERIIQLIEEKNGSKNANEQLQSVLGEMKKLLEKSRLIPINGLWRLNHWGSNCASIVNGKMVFRNSHAPSGTDGCHIDINESLEIGKTYEISCWAKSAPDTTGKFQLWCHDQTASNAVGISNKTEYETPSTEGQKIFLTFQPAFNKNIRIHLQYQPGKGEIEVSNVKITEVTF